MAPHPLTGKDAPSITLPNQDGEETTIKPGSTGTPLALFFYPASGVSLGTYGCTKEACAFRDALKDVEVFKRSNITVVGISGDAVVKQKQFVDQHGLPYPVLSDSKGEARKAYQVKKGLLGLTEGRVTFFIDSKGVVRGVLSSVINPNEHVSFVRKSLTALEEEAKASKSTPVSEPAPQPGPVAEPVESVAT
ncbi:peroxiredoxin Q [Ramaria rubella]|nr:peroxiredoxin Q [Ramaria rubella]